MTVAVGQMKAGMVAACMAARDCRALRRCMTISDQMGTAAVVVDVLRDAQFERRWRSMKGLAFGLSRIPIVHPACSQT